MDVTCENFATRSYVDQQPPPFSLMDSQSGFDKLPVELCGLIFDSIQYTETVSVLSAVSKRNYAIFTPLLYQTARTNALGTLAMPAQSRTPLKSPHPASFVKELELEFKLDEDQSEEQMRQELKMFRRDIGRAMENLITHAPSGGPPKLQTYWFACEFLSFPEAFGKVDLSLFSALKEVKLQCEFPKTNIRKCLSMLARFL